MLFHFNHQVPVTILRVVFFLLTIEFSSQSWNFPSSGMMENPSSREDSQLGVGSPSRGPGSPLQELYRWKLVDFIWPKKTVRMSAIRNKDYIPNNTLILDVDVYEGSSGKTVFVTLPRASGVPATLATVSTVKRDGAPLLAPFPDWPSNRIFPCGEGIVSVFRTQVDPCGRLWVLDTGFINAFTGSNSKMVCPPQILVYDLNDGNRLIGRYSFPLGMYEDHSLMVTIAVDTRTEDCSDAVAYMADSMAYKLIVFDLQTEEFWRINNLYFFPYPDQSRFNVAGVPLYFSGGIFGLALGPVERRSRRLYFHSIDSVKQSWVDTAVLRNRDLWRSNMNAERNSFNLFNGTRSSQSTAATMNPEGIMFFGLLGSDEVACWNSKDEFDSRNMHVVAKDNQKLQFYSGIKVYEDKLYIATCRLQNYIMGRVPVGEHNYRVLVGDVKEMTRGTGCQGRPPTSQAMKLLKDRPSNENSIQFPEDSYKPKDQITDMTQEYLDYPQPEDVQDEVPENSYQPEDETTPMMQEYPDYPQGEDVLDEVPEDSYQPEDGTTPMTQESLDVPQRDDVQDKSPENQSDDKNKIFKWLIIRKN